MKPAFAPKALPRLSVVVPVHGTERYLRECLDSLVDQRLDGLEAILVNDGSPDRSQDIIDDYCWRHPFMSCIEQPASGVAEARNAGLERATGDYVAFLDSDDAIPRGAYAFLLAVADRTGADVCTGIAESFSGERRWVNQQMAELYDCVCSGARLDDQPDLARDSSPCNKIVSRALVESEGLRFPAGVSLREDLHLVLRAYAAAERITVLPSLIYRYRARDPTAPPSLTARLSPDAVDDLLWVGREMSERLAGLVSDAVMREHHKGLAANIAYRLGPFLRDGADPEGRRLFDATRRYLERVDPHALGELPRPREGLLMACVQRGEEEAARACASDLDDESLRARLSDAGLRGEPGIERAAERLVAPGPRAPGTPPPSPPVGVDRPPMSWARRRLVRVAGRAGARARRTPDETVWLVGERRGTSAEDTGYHFFAWCRRNHPELPVYYVAHPDATGRDRLGALGNVLTYGSTRAFEMLLRARVLVYSDSGRDFFDPWRRAAPRLRADAIGCFLQHGVIGLSGMGSFYEKAEMRARGERIDCFVASSEREREIIVDRLGFAPEEVVASGLTRFDALAPSATADREILVAPTWRDWLRWRPTHAVARSEYFGVWQSFIADRALHAVLEERDLHLAFAPHFGMHRHLSLFRATHPRVRVAAPGERPLQDWIQRASLLVTDFSSVSFDVAYRRAPVLYYPFDAARFFEVRGGMLLDPDTELPGHTVLDPETLVGAIAEAADRGFEMEPEMRARADRLLPPPDGRCRERLFDALVARLG